MLYRISNEIVKYFQPNAVVIQCGADGLTGDELGGFNLTLNTFGFCLKQVLNWKKPTLILGGGNIYFSNFCSLSVLVFINIVTNIEGGYRAANVARCWTYLTSIALGRTLSNNIPDNKVNFLNYLYAKVLTTTLKLPICCSIFLSLVLILLLKYFLVIGKIITQPNI